MAVDFQLELLEDGVGDLLVSDLAVDAVVAADRGRDDHHRALQPAGQDFGFDLLLDLAVALELLLELDAAHNLQRGGAGEALGDQEVAGVAVGDLGEVTDAADILDVG